MDNKKIKQMDDELIIEVEGTSDQLVHHDSIEVTKTKKMFKWYFFILKSVVLFVAFSILYSYTVPYVQESSVSYLKTEKREVNIDSVKMAKQNKELEKQLKKLESKLETKTPKGPYLTVSTVMNEFSLYKNKKIYRHGRCSTGSYILLEAGDNQKWMFKTPKGEFHIHGKTSNPVWRKPDWAFVEEGLPVPSANHYTRYEYGVLGDYALSLGQGYLLHGTLYKRFLGLPVTHGCIRLNDEDLEVIYKNLDYGSKVYIY